MKSRRPYVMRARADAAEATRARILDATVGLGRLKFVDDLTLDEIATEAGVTVQTVLRVFGGKSELATEAWETSMSQIRAQRSAPVGDVAASIRALFDHYEETGDSVVLRLAEEVRRGKRDSGLEKGRRFHRGWVESQFAPQLERLAAPEQRGLVDALVVACDVYGWKLLRRDLRLSRHEAEIVMGRMVAGVLQGAARGHSNGQGVRP